MPALFINAVGGQNGAMTAALLGGGLMLVDRRPIIAGILFGMMIYKPHLAVMLPFALLAGRRWLVAFVTGATAALLVVISVAVYGVDAWLHYQHNIDCAAHGDPGRRHRRLVSHGVGIRVRAAFWCGRGNVLWLAGGRRAGCSCLHCALVVARRTCSYPQRRSDHRHLSGDSLFAGLRSGVWCVRRGVAAYGGEGFEGAAAMDSRRHGA